MTKLINVKMKWKQHDLADKITNVLDQDKKREQVVIHKS